MFREIILKSCNCSLTLNKNGSREFLKMSFPVHCGNYSELETDEFIFHFNLNNEIIRAKKKGDNWSHPHEWLKRTIGNDWVYYSTGGYTGVFDATGEYYLPNFTYPTNNILGGNPFLLPQVLDLTDNWYSMLQELQGSVSPISKSPYDSKSLQHSLDIFLPHTPQTLEKKAEKLFEIIGGRISVLPPDARHVDYNLIPLTISIGCLYKCRFCKVKNNTPFTELSRAEITGQLNQLKLLFDKDLANFNSIFLGEHDALAVNYKLILHAVEESSDKLQLHRSNILGSSTFFFGSVDSLLNTPAELFRELDRLPGNTFINIGFESADQATLDHLGKPIQESNVRDAFQRIQEINREFGTVEITSNFIMDENLPSGHYPKILELIRDSQQHKKPKGAVYFSPLTFGRPSRSKLFAFNRLKILSRLPTYLYTIQRL